MQKKATWIWYFGDFELYHHLQISMHRFDYGHFIPAFWKVEDCHRCVRFKKIVNITVPETVRFTADGICSITVDEKIQDGMQLTLPAGKHEIIVNVYNSAGIPALFVEGKTVVSDASWLADITMTMFGSHYKPVGYWNLNNKRITPTAFSLPEKRIEPKLIGKKGNERIYDFGREVNIRLVLSGCGKKYRIYYGESLEEVQDNEFCVLRDEIVAEQNTLVTEQRGCRYVRIVGKPFEKIYGLNQYLPKNKIGKFRSENQLLNRIYDVSKYTYDVTAGLFFIEGLKRDKWVWSGDSFVANLCDFYYCFDQDIIKRNIIALRGRDPIITHVNGIVDFSLYLIISVGIYYMYTADRDFVFQVYESMKTLLDYRSRNLTKDGLFIGDETVWTFVDWADMTKEGAVCAIQMLYCEALKTMADMAELLGLEESCGYTQKYRGLRDKINCLYWSEKRGAYVTTLIGNKQVDEVRRHANIFAILFDIANKDQKTKILQGVLMNPDVPALTTPFFSFFENAALCRMGLTDMVRERIEQYWGGMLQEGATTFWEEYDPKQTGIEKYAMYGRKFEKSLCHAWGASPVYLIGRYIAGVAPRKPGYEEFEVKPRLSGLKRFTATVPIHKGKVGIAVSEKLLKVFTDSPGGKLVYQNAEYTLTPGEEFILELE